MTKRGPAANVNVRMPFAVRKAINRVAYKARMSRTRYLQEAFIRRAREDFGDDDELAKLIDEAEEAVRMHGLREPEGDEDE